MARLRILAAAVAAVTMFAGVALAVDPTIPFNIELNTGGTLYGNPPVDQSDVPASDGGDGHNSCAPTANTNSLAYLTNAYPSTYGNKLLQDKPSPTGAANPQPNTTAGWDAIATELASNDYMMTTDAGGTSVANWISGTMSYINNNAPGTTKYEQANNPTADFLYSQLLSGEDLEIAIFPTGNGIGHVLTVTSMNGTLDDVTGDIITASIDGIDPADPTNPFTYNLDLSTSPIGFTYGGNPYTIGVGFAESPVPEPASLLLLIPAFGLFLRRRPA